MFWRLVRENRPFFVAESLKRVNKQKNIIQYIA